MLPSLSTDFFFVFYCVLVWRSMRGARETRARRGCTNKTRHQLLSFSSLGPIFFPSPQGLGARNQPLFPCSGLVYAYWASLRAFRLRPVFVFRPLSIWSCLASINYLGVFLLWKLHLHWPGNYANESTKEVTCSSPSLYPKPRYRRG